MIMKTTFLICSSILALGLNAPAQTPPPPPPDAAAAPALSATPVTTVTPPVATVSTTPVATVTVAPSTTVAPTTAPSASPDTDDDFDRAIEKKIRKHFNVNFDSGHSSHGEDVPWIAIPIVLIVFLTIFGLPVAVVGIILYFSFSKSRAMHKTVRMMVEKGQPVPEALLNPPPVIRQRSDLRRGVVLLMVGAGLMVFFGAVNDWEGGVWSLGIIPFLIGLGYLLVWRLDVRREDASPKV
jgi:H+/gluconate symporter-like permease